VHFGLALLVLVGENLIVRLVAITVSLLFCGAAAFARMGEVRTLTGQTLQGRIRITPEQVLVVNAARGTIFNIPTTNIARISFAPNQDARPEEEGPQERPALGWQEADVGWTRFAGSTRHERGSFTVRSAGMRIEADTDSFHFVYKPVRGDSEIVAEVASIHITHPNAKAGLMMRESMAEYSRNVLLGLTAMQGGVFQVRSTERYHTDMLPLADVFAPQWLKLRRRGDEFSAFVSPNGRVWSLIQRVTMPMSETFYVGLALAGARDGVMNWTTFSKVREARRLITEEFTPQVELTSGSTVTGRPEKGDLNEITFSGAPKVLRVPTDRVARIAFQPLSGDMAWRTRASRPGIFVSNGDFFDGDFRGIQEGALTISSVLYGLREFDIEDDTLALVLHPRKWQPPKFEVETADGCFIRASELTLGDGEVKLREPSVGEIRVPAFEILELRRR
jgi:hypothetical protein